MDDKEQYDFFMVGQRHARDGLLALKKLADSYEKKYGKEAREDFELGVASVIPRFANFSITQEQTKDADYVGSSGTKNYGMENKRNNSYFGTYGIGVQQKYATGEYNDPEKHKGSR